MGRRPAPSPRNIAARFRAAGRREGIATKRMEEMQDIPEASSDSQKQTIRSRLGNALGRSAQVFLTALQTSRVDVVALLIDGENISPDLIAHVLVEAGKFGGVTIRRVYGNITSPNMQRWKEVMAHYALQGMHQTPITPGKNAADIALAVDTMDLLYREQVTRFCLVASDSDYTPLVLRLRAAGCLVIGIGEPKTPLPLVKACTVFVFTDQLVPSPSKTKSPPVSFSPEASAPAVQKAKAKQTVLLATESVRETKDLPAFLKRAYNEATKGKETEWVLVSRLGMVLRQIDPTFKVTTYGQKDLSSLLKQHEDIFEIRKRSAKGGHLEVRLRKPTH